LPPPASTTRSRRTHRSRGVGEQKLAQAKNALGREQVVGVEDEDDLAAGRLEAAVENDVGAAVLLSEDPYPGVSGKGLQALEAVVARAVVDHHHLEPDE
jgi:hypothetical protein